jgi:hypothetical protein
MVAGDEGSSDEHVRGQFRGHFREPVQGHFWEPFQDYVQSPEATVITTSSGLILW